MPYRLLPPIALFSFLAIAPAIAQSSPAPIAASPIAATALATTPIPFPANQAKDVCPDTLLKLAFASTPAASSSGQVRIYDATDNRLVDTIDTSIPAGNQSYTIGGTEGWHYYPVIIDGNTAMIYPHHHTLDYHKSYYVQMDSGVLSVNGTTFPGYNGTSAWIFTTKEAPPAAGASRLVVDTNGSGDFATVQGALDFLPANNTAPVTLFIQPGNYTEIVYFASLSNITFFGANRDGVVIGYANNDRFNSQPGTSERPGPHFYHRSSFMGNHVTGINFVNLTLKNTTPKGGTQAEAIILIGSRNVLRQVALSSLQDTLQINGSAYVVDSYIEGDVDFMWGSGPVFFQNCVLQCLNRGYFTQIRNLATNHGFVYVDCTFDGAPNSAGTYLSRIDPGRFPSSEVVLIDCKLGTNLNPAAWRFDKTATGPDVHFWEYNSTNLSDGKPADVSQRAPFSKQLTLPQDAATIANYRNPEFVVGWVPAPLPTNAAAPAPAQTSTK